MDDIRKRFVLATTFFLDYKSKKVEFGRSKIWQLLTQPRPLPFLLLLSQPVATFNDAKGTQVGQEKSKAQRFCACETRGETNPKTNPKDGGTNRKGSRSACQGQ